MTHTTLEKQKLVNRARRLKGQIDAFERALVADADCGDLMRLITAARGAINGLMAEVLSVHIQEHMIDADRTPSPSEREAASELVGVLRTYLK